MSPPVRLPRAIWPAERNVGGVHRTARYVLATVLGALGLGLLAGWPAAASGLVGPAGGTAVLLAGIVSAVEAHTQKCPGYSAMGINTCELAAGEGSGVTEELT